MKSKNGKGTSKPAYDALRGSRHLTRKRRSGSGFKSRGRKGG